MSVAWFIVITIIVIFWVCPVTLLCLIAGKEGEGGGSSAQKPFNGVEFIQLIIAWLLIGMGPLGVALYVESTDRASTNKASK